MTEPEQLRIEAGGISFAALAWGPPAGPLALCLHGYPDTAMTWRHLGPALAGAGWRVVAPYLRGYTPTGLAPDGTYELGALARDAASLHAALGGDGNAVMIGHDWGASAAYLVVADPDCPFARAVTLAIPPLRGLASLAAPRNLPRNLPLLARQLTLSWYMFFHQLPLISERALPRLVPFLWRRWSPGYDGREDVTRALASLSSGAARTAALAPYRALMQPWRRDRRYSAEAARLLGPARVPLLVLHGERDGCAHPELARRAAASLSEPDRLGMVSGAGHFLHLEQPDSVNRLILSFIGPATSAGSGKAV